MRWLASQPQLKWSPARTAPSIRLRASNLKRQTTRPHPARRDGERDGELIASTDSPPFDPISLVEMVKKMAGCAHDADPLLHHPRKADGAEKMHWNKTP